MKMVRHESFTFKYTMIRHVKFKEKIFNSKFGGSSFAFHIVHNFGEEDVQ